MNIATVLVEMGRWNECAIEYEQALAAGAPAVFGLLESCAHAKARAGHPAREGVAAYVRAFGGYPTRAEPLFWLAAYLYSIGFDPLADVVLAGLFEWRLIRRFPKHGRPHTGIAPSRPCSKCVARSRLREASPARALRASVSTCSLLTRRASRGALLRAPARCSRTRVRRRAAKRKVNRESLPSTTPRCNMTTRRALRPPAGVPFRHIEGLSDDVSRLQRAIEDSTRKGRQDPQKNGVTVRVRPKAAGELTFSHKLGRKPNGVRIESQRGTAVTFTEVLRTTRLLRLNFSGKGDLELFVY